MSEATCQHCGAGEIRCRSLCHPCYDRARRTGAEMPPKGQWRADPLKRLLDKVAVVEEGCWIWTGYLRADGYGAFKLNGQVIGAHRAHWLLVRSPVPDELELDHLCRVRSCVNLDHLEPVPGIVNNRRGQSFAAENARKTTCAAGHEFTPDNTYVWRGGRICRTCRRARDAKKRLGLT